VKAYNGYLLDLDGTIYRGREVIPEARQFLAELRAACLPYLYLTNNSSATPEAVTERLRAMGIPAEPEEVVTSSLATAAWLAETERPGATVYVIGEEGLRTALQQQGFHLVDEQPDVVAVGIDRSFTYEKLAAAARAIRAGARFVATNPDLALPTENGLVPGNGALMAAVAAASGTAPVVIGKPEPIIVRYALARLGTAPDNTLIVGDNLLTDIAAGVNSGLDSLLVLTGYSRMEDLADSPWQPTHIADHLLAWWDQVKRGSV